MLPSIETQTQSNVPESKLLQMEAEQSLQERMAFLEQNADSLFDLTYACIDHLEPVMENLHQTYIKRIEESYEQFYALLKDYGQLEAFFDFFVPRPEISGRQDISKNYNYIDKAGEYMDNILTNPTQIAHLKTWVERIKTDLFSLEEVDLALEASEFMAEQAEPNPASQRYILTTLAQAIYNVEARTPLVEEITTQDINGKTHVVDSLEEAFKMVDKYNYEQDKVVLDKIKKVLLQKKAAGHQLKFNKGSFLQSIHFKPETLREVIEENKHTLTSADSVVLDSWLLVNPDSLGYIGITYRQTPLWNLSFAKYSEILKTILQTLWTKQQVEQYTEGFVDASLSPQQKRKQTKQLRKMLPQVYRELSEEFYQIPSPWKKVDPDLVQELSNATDSAEIEYLQEELQEDVVDLKTYHYWKKYLIQPEPIVEAQKTGLEYLAEHIQNYAELESRDVFDEKKAKMFATIIQFCLSNNEACRENLGTMTHQMWHGNLGVPKVLNQFKKEMQFGDKTYTNVVKLNVNDGDRLVMHYTSGELEVEFMDAETYHKLRKK